MLAEGQPRYSHHSWTSLEGLHWADSVWIRKVLHWKMQRDRRKREDAGLLEKLPSILNAALGEENS